MKKITFVIISIMIVAACTKTKTNTITVTKNDTTVVTYMPTIIGTWQSSTGVSPIVFDTLVYTVQSQPSIPYIASPNTIYDISQTNLVYVQWTYKLSAHNDTLVLTSRTGVTDIYLRH